MSAMSAALFAWLHGADFYRDMHLDAAASLPDGAGRTWLDVGCGPGLLTRIAADKGYSALGIDRDADMIAAARRLALERTNSARFDVRDIETVCARGERYDVVSASSLLVVLPDPAAGLRLLASLAKPGGSVLIVEASGRMTRIRAFERILSGDLGRCSYMLALWSMFRSGRALKDSVFVQPGLRATHLALLGGLARATISRDT